MSSTLKASSLQNLDQEFFGSKRAIPEPILESIQQQPISSSTIVNNNNRNNNLLLQHQKQNKRSASIVSASSAASSTVSCDSSSASPVLEFTLPSQQRKRELLLQQQQKEKKENEQKQQQQERVQSSSSSSKLVQLLQQNTTTSSTSNSSSVTVPPHRVFNLKNSNNNSNNNNSLGTRSSNDVVDLLRQAQASAAANAIAISSSTTSTTISATPSAVVYNPLASDWRTLSITSNISKFEPTLISRLEAWKKNYGISSTILQVTAPNACGIVRLFPVVPTTANSSSSVSSSANQQQQQATAISSSVSAASLMTVVSKQNAAWSAALPPSFGIFSEINKKIQQEKQQQTQTQPQQQAATFAPLAPIDLPACANLSRSIVAVIMSTLDVCTRLEMSVLRVICHDFSEFSHPSTLHNSNNTAMLISMFENVVSPSTTQTTQQEVQQQNNNKISYSEKVLRGPSTFSSSPAMTSESKEPATFKSLQLGSYPIADFYSADGSRAPITTRTNNNFGSVGNLNKVVASTSQDFSNNNQQQNLVGAISSVASAILLSDNNNNNGKQQKYQNHNIYFSKIDAFFSVPVVSPFLLYSQHKPQHYVMEHQKSGLENSKQNNNNNVAIYKVMDLVHDNRALQSLIYPEQWIYSLCYFVAEVLMLFDGRDTPCRIRHAEKAISVFPSFVFAAFENNGSGTSAYQQSLTISTFSELRQALYEVANLELFPHQGDKKALQSRIPPRRHDSENENNNNTTINSNVEHAHHSEDTVARFIFFVYERLRLVQKGKYLKLANFLRSICEMPLGVIPIARSSTTTTKQQQNNNNNAASFVPSSENAPRDPPVATPSQIGGAESLFYGFHRRGLTCAETSLHHHHFVNRVAYRTMTNSNNTSTTAIATSAVSTRLLPPPPQYQQQPFRGIDSTTPPYQPVLKLSDEQSQELKRWKMIHGVTNCVIHVYGNEHKKVIYLTPISSCLNDDQQVKEAAPSSEAAASISWTINQQHHQQQQNSSSRSVTADYLTAAMTIAENEAQAPCLRIIFHNLWAFRDAKLTIADFTPEDPFFVAYVMSAVKNTDRLIDLLFINNNYQPQQQNETSVDSSITSNDSNKTQNSASSQPQNQQQPLIIAENHWIGGMLKFLRSCLKFLKNFNANKENLEKNLDEAMRLLHNFRSPLLNLVELKTGLMSFVSFMLSSSSGNNDLASYFDNSESILDWLSSLLSAITFLQEMNERKMKNNNNEKDSKKENSSIDFPVLIKTIRFLITVCVLPMRPTQHQVFEADERGRKIVADAAADAPNTETPEHHHKNNKSNNKTYEEKNKKHENSRNNNKSVSQQSNNTKNNTETQNNNSKSGTTRRGGHRRGSKQ